MNQRGFTMIELLVLIVLVGVIGSVFWSQKNAIETSVRDEKRKVSVNAIYYSLEEVYKKANNSYPKSISSATLPSVDPELLKDPEGRTIGTAESDLRYEPKGCDGDTCKGYSLRANLESEADYIKENR